MSYFIICDKSKKANKSFRPFGSIKAAKEAISKRMSLLAKVLGITVTYAKTTYGSLFIIKEVKENKKKICLNK